MAGMMVEKYDWEMGQRIESLIAHLGMDKSVSVSGKSEKQLQRYCAGSEPPFSVLQALAYSAGATLDWVATGEVGNNTDFLLEEDLYAREATRLERLIKRAREEPKKAELRDQLDLVRSISRTIAEERLDIQREEGNLPEPLQLSRNRKRHGPARPKSDASKIGAKVAALVLEVYRASKVKLPEIGLATEAAQRTVQLLAKSEDPADLQELESLLPWLRNQIEKELVEARAEPGTGKHSAS
ncbi:hypothetical protein [Shinella sp.]|uniref:hypothetical protein n=1 Tax=Shinella sp. TaxID=1870904 RepID=UPI0039E4FA40